jgi:3-oxosteroid 1-dehydrogenase
MIVFFPLIVNQHQKNIFERRDPMSKGNLESALSRRDFIKGTALGTGATLMGLRVGEAGAKVISPPQKWDKEADVIVVGYGAAGACAAIEARDVGAEVLILEKQPKATHYNNTRMSGGFFHSPDPSGDRAALKAYALAMFSGQNLPWMLEGEQSDDIANGLAEAFAEYAPQNADFMKKQDPEFKIMARGEAAFSNFPGAKEAKYRVFVSTYTGRMTLVNPTKDLPKSEKMAGEAFFACLNNGVETRKIEVMYGTPAAGLVVSNEGEVIGVVVKRGGQEMACKAKRGVVLTSGGYAYHKGMRRAFLEGPGVDGYAFYGSPHNTGDGIEMAMRVGAALAKMGEVARITMSVPIQHHGLNMGIQIAPLGSPNSIVVDNFGYRYTAETLMTDDPSRYLFSREARKFDIQKLLYPRDPSWMVFDETLRARTTITPLGIAAVGFGFVPWTKDNMDAIKRGWILKGDTIEELAAKIKERPENRKLMESTNLVKTVSRFNEFCKMGKDEDFNRRPPTLGPIDKPPFYALPLYPGGGRSRRRYPS